jgi:hypothetical protein
MSLLRATSLTLLSTAGCGGSSTPPESHADDDGDGVDTPADCNDADAFVHPGEDERCDGRDNDCDGTIDVGAVDATTVWQDLDRDGFGTGPSQTSCPSPGWVANDRDCDDTRADVNPNAWEVCDASNIDEDCDLLADDDDDDAAWPATFYRDADGDGFGADDAKTTACDGAAGYVTIGGDCDDAFSDVNPDAIETCGDAIYDDCDGSLGCALDGDVSVADADLTLTGTFEHAELGHEIAPAGDVDGDGRCDLIVTANNTVGAFLFLGPLTTSTTEAAVARISGDGKHGTLTGDAFSLGDQDRDGYYDFVVPSAVWDGEPPLVRWYVFLGPIAGDVDADLAAAATIDDGVNYGGPYPSSAGDVSGDGVADLLLGQSGLFTYGAPAYLYMGPATNGARSASDADASFWSDGLFDDVGAAVCADGDLDDDGIDDALVTAAGYDKSAGLAGLFFGPVLGEQQVDEADVIVRSGGVTMGLGWRASTSGDLGGDGTRDLVIGSRNFTDLATVYVLSDIGAIAETDVAAADAVIEADPSRPGFSFGYQIATGRDLDGDAVDDLVLSDPYTGAGGVLTEGNVWGFHGPLSGTVSASTDAAFVLSGIGTFEQFGAVVTVLPDMTGDGFDDLAVSAATAPMFGSVPLLPEAVGTVYVFASGP